MAYNMAPGRKNPFTDQSNVISSSEPYYNYHDDPSQNPQWYQVRYWRKRTMFLTGLAIIIVIVVAIVVPVEVVRANAYPDYSKLNYSLTDKISGTSFFDSFDYFTGYDPTHGFVHYLLKDQQTPYNLTYASADRAVIRVDDTLNNQSTGRYSVRLTSTKTYNNGLFLIDVYHTPYGCGSWPALWLADPTPGIWPANGEIDILEAVNNGTTGNQMTLHTADGCTMNAKRKETGTALTTNCWNGTDSNAGCGVSGAPSTFGPALNAAGGAMMAMELRSAGIRMWQFGRGAIPADITAGTPDPSTWGEALADFPSTHCDIASHFRNQSIIIDITLCGDWAGAQGVYTTQFGCPSNCTAFVADNPAAFATAYWELGAIQVYQAPGA